MSRQIGDLQVILAPNGFRPVAFRWQGRLVRVLAVESVRTFGAERRYGVRARQGDFELGVYPDSGVWVLRRGPNWFSRVCSCWRDTPRFPLPFWRRRARMSAATPRRVLDAVGTGGDHGDGFALVR